MLRRQPHGPRRCHVGLQRQHCLDGLASKDEIGLKIAPDRRGVDQRRGQDVGVAEGSIGQLDRVRSDTEHDLIEATRSAVVKHLLRRDHFELTREKLLGALEALGTYDGLIKTYSNPFSPDRHEALGPDDYEMSVWKGPRLELIG